MEALIGHLPRTHTQLYSDSLKMAKTNNNDDYFWIGNKDQTIFLEGKSTTKKLIAHFENGEVVYFPSEDGLITKFFQLPGKTIGTGTTLDFDFDIALSGYTPIGAIGTRLSDYGNASLVYSDILEGNKARVRICNNGSSSVTGDYVSIRILYKKL